MSTEATAAATPAPSPADTPTTPPTHPEGRTRFVYQQWVRDPNGPLLTRPPPMGVRPPNELIWGHTLQDFFWLQRIPNVDVITIWSRSMIKEFGENYDESEFDEPDALQVPRRRHPWPVLKVSNDGVHVEKNSYGVIDEGCYVQARPDYAPKRREIDEQDLEAEAMTKTSKIAKLFFGFDDASKAFVPNDPHYSLRSADGWVYALLFSSHIRSDFLGTERAELPPQTISFPELSGHKEINGVNVAVELDEYGVYVVGDDTGTYAFTDDECIIAGGGPAPVDQPSGIPASDETSEAKLEDRTVLDESAPRSQPSDLSLTQQNPSESSAPTDIVKIPKGSVSCDETNDQARQDATVSDEPAAGCDPENSPSAPSATEVDALAEDNVVKVNAVPLVSSDNASDEGDSDEAESDSDDVGETDPVAPSTPNTLPTTGSIPFDSPFSVQDLPKLEEPIPVYYFPDTLLVHDPHERTHASSSTYNDVKKRTFPLRAPLEYRRVFPKLPRDDAQQRDQPTSPWRIAHLHIAHQNRMGVGNHSLVHCAPLTLPPPLSAHSRNGKVTVAAKSAFAHRGARELLANEAKMYDRFPAHMSEDWCGYNLVTPIKHPVPVGPVVPKLFGYYVPVKQDGTLHKETDGAAPSPILLLEECGEPVEPGQFSADERSECYSMMLRLHYEGLTQGSFYVRNIMVQPGPLTAPPEQRSKKTPSFRIIDFGRGEQWDAFVGDKTDKDRVERKQREWGNKVSDEDRRAQRELQISFWNY